MTETCETDDEGRCSVHGEARWRCSPFVQPPEDPARDEEDWTWDGG